MCCCSRYTYYTDSSFFGDDNNIKCVIYTLRPYKIYIHVCVVIIGRAHTHTCINRHLCASPGIYTVYTHIYYIYINTYINIIQYLGCYCATLIQKTERRRTLLLQSNHGEHIPKPQRPVREKIGR